MSSHKYFDARSDEGVVVIQLANPERYDTADYGDLQAELLCFVEQAMPRLLVVEFENVTYCSTAVISSLMQLRKRLGECEGKLKLAGLTPEVREAFGHLRLDGTMFEIYANAAAAVADA